jgi:hypothetical protein
MGRFALVLLLAALVGPVAARAADAPPTGYRTHTVSNAGLSIAVPIGWQVLSQHDAVFPGARENLERLQPGFGATLSALGLPDSPLKLFAFDRRFARGHPTTLMVVQETYTPPGAYNRWAPRMSRALRRVRGRVGALAARGVDLPSGLALRASYRTSTQETVVVYLVPGRSGLWAVMLRTPTSRASRDGRALGRMAWSLVLKSPLGGPYSSPQPPGS